MSTRRPRSVRASFFLHMHPDAVHPQTLRTGSTLGLGTLAVALLLVLLVTGVALMFGYVPSPGPAYDRMMDMRGGAQPALGLFRDIHRLASDALVVVTLLHMARVFLTGALGERRRLNWLVGLGLMLLVLATAFTGFLLPWDRAAYWAATVGGELVGAVPGAGPWMRGALWGSDAVSADTLLRAYALHVAALPIPGALLLAYHMWRIRKAGGLARPAQTEAAPLIPTRPALTVRELGIALGATALLVALALVWDAPLGPPGDPPRPIDPAKAPWFFLWVQELVSYSTLLGGAAPIVLLGLLALAPLGERRADLAGSWLARPRLGRCLAFVAIALAIAGLTAVAAFLRGPGWRFTGR